MMSTDQPSTAPAIPPKTMEEAIRICGCVRIDTPCDLAKAIALALFQRDQQLAEARRQERADVATWYEETFCDSSGVGTDEKHARGDCGACNIAAAIRSLPEEE